MKASVQYNDFKGTSAADISDHISHLGGLSQYLNENGVDTERYSPVGIDVYSGNTDHFRFSIICQDRQNDNNIVEVAFEEKQSPSEFFNLFKRFNVILISRNVNLEHIEDEPKIIYFDNREDG
jgi:hypothetical protein